MIRITVLAGVTIRRMPRPVSRKVREVVYEVFDEILCAPVLARIGKHQRVASSCSEQIFRSSEVGHMGTKQDRYGPKTTRRL